MVNYILNLINEIKRRIAGIDANTEKWANLPVAKADLENAVAQLEASQGEIDQAMATLQQKREAARILVEQLSLQLNQVDNLAKGIHAMEPVKLGEYGLSLRKDKSSRPVPGKAFITSIADDADGEGFILTLTKLPDATHYQVEKGMSVNGEVNLSPPYPFFRTTTKIVFVDDDVIKGKRYFYRVRGVNPTGTGEWSEPVSRVQ